MLVGVATAIAHGVGLPLLMVVFGETTDVFSNEFLTRDIARSVNESVDDLNCTHLNMICSTTERDTCGFFVEDDFCTTSDDLVEEINRLVIFYCALGVTVFISGWLHISLFQYACERQLHVIRKKFFHSILRQEIGWFDVNNVGELNSRINE